MTDKSTTYRVNSLLTEHFGFPPLSLIDDVINAVNEIMYKCSQAMEEYLRKRQEAGELFSTEEIVKGTAKLETLLESQVDKNFDKFELYTLRNIFTLPHDLVEQGYIRLKHQEGIDFVKDSTTSKKQLDSGIGELVKNISHELHIRKILKLQIAKANKIIKICKLYQTSLKVFDGNFLLTNNGTDGGPELSPLAKAALKSLSPLDETLYFILNQVHDLNTQTTKLLKKVDPGHKSSLLNLKVKSDLRTDYIDAKSMIILQKLGVVSDPDFSDSSIVVPEVPQMVVTPSLENVQSVKDIVQEMQQVTK
jgi:kinetochore protein Mis12/MTW1